MTIRPENLNTEITIVRGSGSTVEYWITGPDDNFVDLNPFTRCRLTWRASASGPALLVRDSDAGDAAIDVGVDQQNFITMDPPSSGEWDTLPDVMICDVAVTDGTEWWWTEPFFVRVVGPMTEVTRDYTG